MGSLKVGVSWYDPEGNGRRKAFLENSIDSLFFIQCEGCIVDHRYSYNHCKYLDTLVRKGLKLTNGEKRHWTKLSQTHRYYTANKTVII